MEHFRLRQSVVYSLIVVLLRTYNRTETLTLSRWIIVTLYQQFEVNLNLTVSIPLYTYNIFIKLCRLYTTNKYWLQIVTTV